MWQLGLVIMVVSQAMTLAGIEPFSSWNTPIAWTGFILFADSVVYKARGNSWIRSSPREFIALACSSIVLWLVFEFFNLYIENWHYVGLPQDFRLRMFGYAWAFATIWPAIFEASELIAVVRSGPSAAAEGARDEAVQVPRRPLPWWSIGAGALMLALPFLVESNIARFLAAPVWLGFIFLLDPVNERLGDASLFRDIRQGRFDRLVNLSASGILCGVLWEFWNYWAHAKWHYTVPIMERIRIFEMPVLGYLGFPAFALECFTMYVFVRLLAARMGFSSRETGPVGREIAL